MTQVFNFFRYPTLTFKPAAFFAMGSPVGMFLAVRGKYWSAELIFSRFPIDCLIDWLIGIYLKNMSPFLMLGVTQIAEDYALPTCPRFFNIFHPVNIVYVTVKLKFKVNSVIVVKVMGVER